eukprot:3238633-Rhodomonas_salina.2
MEFRESIRPLLSALMRHGSACQHPSYVAPVCPAKPHAASDMASLPDAARSPCKATHTWTCAMRPGLGGRAHASWKVSLHEGADVMLRLTRRRERAHSPILAMPLVRLVLRTSV